MTASLPALYAILDTDVTRARGLEPLAVVAAWLEAGVRLIQLRAKSLPLGPMVELADSVVSMARPFEATVIINDRADVARLSGAAGVHLGQDDLTVADVRAIVGPDALVGWSTHSIAQAVEACQVPVSYVAMGPVFATATKAQPDPVVGVAGVRAVASLAGEQGIPVVAIGGITLDRALAVLEVGATSVAVISDLLVGDPAARARAWLDVLSGTR